MHFDKLKELLKDDQWIENREGEFHMNGEISSYFMKDDVIIGLTYYENPDEEMLDELFGSEDDMAPSIVQINNDEDELEGD